jgi:hypothetical protein
MGSNQRPPRPQRGAPAKLSYIPPEPHAGIEPAFPAWKAGTLAVVLVRHIETRSPRRFRPVDVAAQRQANAGVSRGSRWDRTSGLLGFNQALCRLS